VSLLRASRPADHQREIVQAKFSVISSCCAPGFGCLAHDSFEARGRLCIGVGRAPVLGDLLLPNQLKEEAAAVLVASGAV